MAFDSDIYIQIAGRAVIFAGLALAGEPDAVAVIHALRHLDGDRLTVLYPALTPARGARVADDPALPPALRAGLLHREKTLLHAHLPMPAAGRAIGGRAALAGARAATIGADRHPGDANLRAGPRYRVFQREFQVITEIRAPVHPAAAPPATAAKDIAKDAVEDIAKPRALPKTGLTRARAGVHPGMAELVIGRAPFCVGKHIVGLFGLLESFLGPGVARVAIRMIFHGQTPVGLFEAGLVGVFCHTEHFVIVSFICHAINGLFS